MSNLLRRSLAMLLLIATLMSFVPNVFAAEADGQIDDEIVIDIPDSLKDEDIVTATFGEDGKIVYDVASDDVRQAIIGREEGTYADVANIQKDRAGTDLSAGQRLAFFIDPSNSQGHSNYTTFSLSATAIKNLVAAGVTDLFVMTKNQAGTFDMTNLKTANSNKGSAKVYAWMHCAIDDAYIISHRTSAQYHFRAGYQNKQNGEDNTVTGFVHLANA